MTLKDNISQGKNNDLKIIDSDFDNKFEEFRCAEKNFNSVKDLFASFFNQTNSKILLCFILILISVFSLAIIICESTIEDYFYILIILVIFNILHFQ